MSKTVPSNTRVAARFLSALEWDSQDFKTPQVVQALMKYWEKHNLPGTPEFEYHPKKVILNIQGWTSGLPSLKRAVEGPDRNLMDLLGEVTDTTSTMIDSYEIELHGTTGTVQIFLREWTEDDNGF